MITALTEDQIAKFPEYNKKWLEIGLSTTDIDVPKALACLKEAYQNVKIPFPDKYEVYDSPFAAIDAMKEKHGISVNADDFIYGAHDTFWLARNDYYLNVLGLECCAALSPFIEFAKHCGWALIYDELVVLTRKPISIKLDAENRTHCENDYAIKFADNTGITIWHGNNVPSEWIFDKSSITPEVLFQWENADQRRCACEIVGWINVLKHLDAKLIDEDPEKTVGSLYEVDLPNSGKERFLVAFDLNVGKMVGLPVAREMQTALEANASTYGIDLNEISPEIFRNAANDRA